jgi:hypothetical protein
MFTNACILPPHLANWPTLEDVLEAARLVELRLYPIDDLDREFYLDGAGDA